MSKSNGESFFVVTFRDPREKDHPICTIKAKKIHDSTLGLSFISVSEFMFDTQTTIVNPTEEQMRKRFENIRSLHLSIHSILSIEEVGLEHKGLNFAEDRSNLVTFPQTPPPQI